MTIIGPFLGITSQNMQYVYAKHAKHHSCPILSICFDHPNISGKILSDNKGNLGISQDNSANPNTDNTPGPGDNGEGSGSSDS